MAATKTHANGGTYSVDSFFVQPVFTFTRVSDGNVRVFDTALEGQLPVELRTIGEVPWVTTEPADNPFPNSCGGPDFYVVPNSKVELQSPNSSTHLLLRSPGPPSPYFAIDSQQQWDDALLHGRVRPMTQNEWENVYMPQWNDPLNLQGNDPYPANTFLPATLYSWGNESGNYQRGVCVCAEEIPLCLCDQGFTGDTCDPVPGTNTCFCDMTSDGGGWNLAPGLVMSVGDGTEQPGDYSSAWIFQYQADPDLSNATISIKVFPPCGVNAVSFGMQDVNGYIRAWYWNVAVAAGPGTLACGVSTTISINTSILGITAATPTANSFMNNPLFDITQVLDFIVDENFVWVGQQPVPPPGTIVPNMWNYWHDLIVTPNVGSKPTPGFVKWSQPPVQCDEQQYLGWDEISVKDFPPLLADDWLCLDERPITDIHWWGSFQDWFEPEAGRTYLKDTQERADTMGRRNTGKHRY